MKPSYEELEQKLAESERYGRQTDITIDNLEMQLKTEREAKLALAAENAGLKAFGDKLYSMYKGLETSGGGFHDEQSIPYQQAALDAAMSAFEEIKTPATDAFLAEVRASAVDEVCLKISNTIVNCYQDEQVGLDAAATICGDFAAQLRKGVQS